MTREEHFAVFIAAEEERVRVEPEVKARLKALCAEREAFMRKIVRCLGSDRVVEAMGEEMPIQKKLAVAREASLPLDQKIEAAKQEVAEAQAASDAAWAKYEKARMSA